MKKLLIILCLLLGVTACSEDANDTTDNNPIKNLEFPLTTTPLQLKQPVTIKGEGFTESDQIWIKAIASKSTGNDMLQAVVTAITSTSITFTLPSDISPSSNDTWTFEIILKQNEKFYSLGKLKFVASPAKYYTFSYDKDKMEFAEIDINTGAVTWTGWKIPEYGSNSRGAVFNEVANEIITFGDNRKSENYWAINRLNLDTKKVTTYSLSNLQGAMDFDEIIKSKDNKYYAFCYDKEKMELAEIDINTGKLTWDGWKIPEYGSNSRGAVFNEADNETITFGGNRESENYWVINRLNLNTKKVITLPLKNLKDDPDFDNIIKL